MKTLHLFLVGAVCLVIASCTGIKPLKPGHARHISATGAEMNIAQTENPKQPTTTFNESKTETTRVIPKGSVMRETFSTIVPVRLVNGKPVDKKQLQSTNTTIREITLSEDMKEVTKVEDNSRISLGAAQHDESRKLAAGYMSARWIQGLGAFMIVAGCCFAFIPYLRLLTGATFGMILGGVGLGIVVLAHAMVGNETLIILLTFGGLGAYLFIHRYGKKSGQVEAMKAFIDENKNGLDDREEAKAGSPLP